MFEPPDGAVRDAALLPGPGAPHLLPVLGVNLAVVDIEVVVKSVLSLVELDLFGWILQVFKRLFRFDELLSFRVQFRVVSHSSELPESVGTTKYEQEEGSSVFKMSIVDNSIYDGTHDDIIH